MLLRQASGFAPGNVEHELGLPLPYQAQRRTSRAVDGTVDECRPLLEIEPRIRGRLPAIYLPSRRTNAVAKAVKTSFQPICYLGEGRPGAFLIKLTTGRSAHT